MSDAGPGAGDHDPSAFPPPGWSAPPPPPSGWSAPPGAPGAWTPPPAGPPTWSGTAYAGAAHKPGAVPLRPLTLSDLYDAAFRIIRFNPRATVGAAVLVAAVSMTLPLVVTLAVGSGAGGVFEAGGDDLGSGEIAALIGTGASFAVGAVLNAVGSLLVTGLVVRVCLAAAVGRRLGLGEAWAETRGQRWRLVGLSLSVLVGFLAVTAVYAVAWVLVVLSESTPLVVAWAVLSIPGFLAMVVWSWVRLAYLPVPAMMVERLGVLASVRRAFALTRRQFWRTLGIAVLTLVITTVAAQVLTTPLSFVFPLVIAGLGPQWTLVGLAVVQALSTVITAAFVTPFTGAVTSLQYLDQRMRKEAYDVELMQQAGVTAR